MKSKEVHICFCLYRNRQKKNPPASFTLSFCSLSCLQFDFNQLISLRRCFWSAFLCAVHCPARCRTQRSWPVTRLNSALCQILTPFCLFNNNVYRTDGVSVLYDLIHSRFNLECHEGMWEAMMARTHTCTRANTNTLHSVAMTKTLVALCRVCKEHSESIHICSHIHTHSHGWYCSTAAAAYSHCSWWSMP